jgi:hypothetical protein
VLSFHVSASLSTFLCFLEELFSVFALVDETRRANEELIIRCINNLSYYTNTSGKDDIMIGSMIGRMIGRIKLPR